MDYYLMLISELDVNPAQLKMLRTKLKHLLWGRRFVKYDVSSQKLLEKHGIRWKGEVPNAPDNGHRGRGCGRSATGEALTDRPPLPKGHGYLSLGTWADAHASSRKLLAKHGLIRSKGEAPNAPDNSHRCCGRSATGEGLTDSLPLPKGHGYLSLGTMVDKHGNVFEIPSSHSALMYCDLCCKEGDHWPRNCPDWHQPEPTSAVQTKGKESKSVVQTQRKKKSNSAAGTNNSSYETKE